MDTGVLVGGPLDGMEYRPDGDDDDDPWVALLVDGWGDVRALYRPDEGGVWRYGGQVVL